MSCPSLLTAGRIASALGVPLHRIQHVLATRSHIRPSARAGTLRLFDMAAVEQIRHELDEMDSRRRRNVGGLGEDYPTPAESQGGAT
jgi:hypothetical protein